jgi:hypothetical protein
MKNAINRSSARPTPTSSWCPPSATCGPLCRKKSGLLEDNRIFRTPSFSDGCSRFVSRPWRVSRRKRLTLDDNYVTRYGISIWAKNGWETARTEHLYGLDDGSWVLWTDPRTPEPSSSPYRSLVRAVSQPFLSQHLRYIVPSSKYLFIVAFPYIWKLLVMATCRRQPFSTVSLIYREPLGSRSHFKVRGWHRGVDSSFLEGCHEAFYEL